MASKKKTLLKPKRTRHVSLLNEDIAKEVKQYIMEGKTLRDIATLIKVNEKTIYNWKHDNVLGFAEMLEKAEAEAELKRVQDFSKRLLQMEEREDGRLNTPLLAIKQREAADLRSSLINARRIYDNKAITNNVVVLPTPILGNLIEAETAKDENSLDNKG
ncbi:MAG TPA: hypothetical protein PKV66_03550 [Candidatus Pelethenecus sp.]|nr:hypothetical protein [Candidatus Pelethenecus sp.]